MTGSARGYTLLALAVTGLVALVVAAGLILKAGDDEGLSRGQAERSPAAAAAGGSTAPANDGAAVMSLHDSPRDLPDLHFKDGSGKPVSLADFRGRVVLLNLWATWCGPCREEMPTLDRLQATLGGPDFEVVALSIDRAGIGAVDAFYADIGVENLARYIDESGGVAQQLSALGLPTTLLLDREGREIARHVGPAEWDKPEMVTFLRRHLAQPSGALRPGDSMKRTTAPRIRAFASLQSSPTLPLAVDEGIPL